MNRLKLEFDAAWSPEKIRSVSVRIRRDIMSYGGVSNVSDITPTHVIVPPPKPRLQLYCMFNAFGNKCGAEWEGDTYTDCPNGHPRKFVHKRPSGYVPEEAQTA